MIRKNAVLVLAFVGVLFATHNVWAQAGPNPLQVVGVNPSVTVEIKLGSGIRDRIITGEDSVFNMNQKVYVWFRVTGASFDSLYVRWKHSRLSYTVPIYIGGNPWRAWAYITPVKFEITQSTSDHMVKRILVSASGKWRVTVLTKSGKPLKEATFTVKTGGVTGNAGEGITGNTGRDVGGNVGGGITRDTSNRNTRESATTTKADTSH